MESPNTPNSYFSQTMGRSENAIKFRRSHLAVKMHQNDPSIPLEEYVSLLNADMDHASGLLQEWNEKRASFKSFIDANRKRKVREMSSSLPGPNPFSASEQRSRFFGSQSAGETAPWENASIENKIDTICKSIREESGNLSSVFNDPQFLPSLIQHYPGFEAYARVVQARTSG